MRTLKQLIVSELGRAAVVYPSAAIIGAVLAVAIGVVVFEPPATNIGPATPPNTASPSPAERDPLVASKGAPSSVESRPGVASTEAGTIGASTMGAGVSGSNQAATMGATSSGRAAVHH